MKVITLIFCISYFLTVKGQSENTIYLRSSGKLPALAFSLGEDRLGAAKMGYIDTNILLRIVDSTKDQYTIQLSKYRTAYIDKSFTKPDSSKVVKKNTYLSNSFIAKGDSLFDYVNINLEEKLPFRTWMELNPSRIMLEIFGVQSNTNWVTQLRSLKEVKNVYYNQTEADVMQVTVELTHPQFWGYSVGYKGKALSIKVKRQPPSLDIRKLKIAIDAGHGGTNAGATGVKLQLAEKEYTLLFAKALQKTLKKVGVKQIIMTRNTDTSFDNKDRILWLQEQNPDFLISLHLNSSVKAEINGVSTYYKHIGYRPLTQAILNRMLELKLTEFGNIGHFNFALNAPTDFPNCLVEIAFLSNEDDEKKIAKPVFHTQVAQKIQLGITDWLKSLSPNFNTRTNR
ncbi:MAG: N-acetylmuramoyl-L-alanine amidase family protein [Sediminibacterium sp.]|jgi:N-acetylmuramoyl-L-alanine amidase|nr:N-acetylmuramoyl-L-alanine amidase [Sediminibacterium sp.]MBX9779613.1 N-acetylmuramoyl-L-alanine amidase [Chitinophagaceae bacterium]